MYTTSLEEVFVGGIVYLSGFLDLGGKFESPEDACPNHMFRTLVFFGFSKCV